MTEREKKKTVQTRTTREREHTVVVNYRENKVRALLRTKLELELDTQTKALRKNVIKPRVR